MCTKELAVKAVNTILRKTFGRLSVADQIRIAGRFGFRITENHWQPVRPELHLPIQPPPDGDEIPIARGTVDDNEIDNGSISV